MNLKPLNNQVIVKPLGKEEVTKSGIVLPESAKQERPEQGEIIAIGDGKLLDNGQRLPMTVKVGERVIFKKYSPEEVKVDGEEYLVLSETDILAIIN